MKKTGCRAFMLFLICLLFFNNVYALDEDNFTIDPNPKSVPSNRLQLTIIIDESGARTSTTISDTKSTPKPIILLSDNWGYGTTGIGGSCWYYENHHGSLQDMKNGDVLQFPQGP